MKAVLPSVTQLLKSPGNTSNTGANVSAKGRKGKKKVQAYEGDELFSSARPVLCPADIDRKVLLVALEGTLALNMFTTYTDHALQWLNSCYETFTFQPLCNPYLSGH
jgi:hypothetical protein